MLFKHQNGFVNAVIALLKSLTLCRMFCDVTIAVRKERGKPKNTLSKIIVECKKPEAWKLWKGNVLLQWRHWMRCHSHSESSHDTVRHPCFYVTTNVNVIKSQVSATFYIRTNILDKSWSLENQNLTDTVK